jgi:hypothetical protein
MILLLPRSQVHERLRNATVHLYISQELIGLMERVSGVDNFASQHRVLSRLSASQTARVHREGGRSQICLIQVCAVDMVCIVRQYMPVPALEQLWLSRCCILTLKRSLPPLTARFLRDRMDVPTVAFRQLK